MRSIKGVRQIILLIGCFVLVMALEFPIARLILGSAKVDEFLKSDEIYPELAFNIAVVILAIVLFSIIELLIRLIGRLKVKA